MNLCINDFEGPLDLLLHLVKTSKMDIYEIDVKYIIDKYLEFIESIPKEDLDDASEYLVMAAELIHLKSRLLLNLETSSDKNEEYSISSEEDLKNKIIEYEKYRSLTEVFKSLEEKRSEFFTRIPENLSEYQENKLTGTVSSEALVNALLEMQKRIDYKKPKTTKITKKEISIEERRKYIITVLKDKESVIFQDLFESFNKEVIIATFLAILDMCKNNEIDLKQEDNFSDIYIKKVN